MCATQQFPDNGVRRPFQEIDHSGDAYATFASLPFPEIGGLSERVADGMGLA